MKKHRLRTKPKEVLFPVDSNNILFLLLNFVNSKVGITLNYNKLGPRQEKAKKLIEK